MRPVRGFQYLGGYTSRKLFVGRPGVAKGVRRSSRAAGMLLLLLFSACADPGTGEGAQTGSGGVSGSSDVELLVDREAAATDAAVARIDSIFQPLPLMTPAQEEALRAFGNADQLARARSLGVGRNLPADSLRALEAAGRLIRLGDTEHWVVRDLDHSQPLAVPAVETALREIGARFQQRLAALGAPPYRMEISSVMRTAADQEALRGINPNASLTESTHEYGTTVDVLYSAFAAPAAPLRPFDSTGAAWIAPLMDRYARLSLERVAGRRSAELKAILGAVLQEVQREGRVMITLERQQPVFHITVASP